jgi:hypothetical protein
MTELFDRDKRQLEMQQPGEEEQSGRNIFILGFFFAAFAGGFLALFHWLAPDGGVKTGAMIFMAGYCAFWLFSKFSKPG